MKYGVITFHRAINFGAIFQTLALQKTLNKLNIDNEVIDYHCEFIDNHYKSNRILSFSSLKQYISDILHNRLIYNNSKNFKEFTKKNIILSSEIYYSNQDLILTNYIYDKIITGSDQVWNYFCAGFDKAYFLDFAESDKKISYAASFGVDEIPEDLKHIYSELLNDFRYISVRENKGKDIVDEILNRETYVVLDPTLLLDSNEWKFYSSNFQIEYEYILVFLISENDSTFNFINQLARKTNLKVVYINDRIFRKIGFKNISKVKPEDWLSLFRNAKYIVTNSYHGVLFSLNFNKEFFVDFLPFPAKVNSRLEDVIQKFNLNERYISRIDLNMDLKKIDYEEVNNILLNERKSSFEYIRKIIEG